MCISTQPIYCLLSKSIFPPSTIKIFCHIFAITVRLPLIFYLDESLKKEDKNSKVSHGMRQKGEWDLQVCALFWEGLNVAVLEESTF